MCGFKVGDEVVCVDASGCPELQKGAEYVLTDVIFFPTGEIGVHVSGVVPEPDGWFTFASFAAERFRKVERKNDSLSIEAFLTIKSGFEEPKRTPAKKRERV